MNGYDQQFADWWAREFPGQSCPPTPRTEQEITMTAHAALRSTNPALFTALFGGKREGVRLGADVSARMASGNLQPQDAGQLRAAGYETLALQCERQGQAQEDQRLAEQMAASKAVYEAEMQRSAQWAEMSLLERMLSQPINPAVAARNRAKWGISS